MRKVLIMAGLVAVSMFTSCKTEEIDANVAAKITGSYSFDSYVTQSGSSTGDLSTNKVVVTRVDDTHVNVTLDYADTAVDDLEASNCAVSLNGDTYTYSKSFSNAELTGTVIGDNLTYDLNYTSSDDFAIATASK